MNEDKIIGLLPMAGKANRLNNLPFSKELFPFSISSPGQDKPVFNVIADLIVSKMKIAGVKNFHFIIRQKKWDILSYYGGGERQNINLSYHLTDNESAVPYTIDQAFPFVKDKTIVFGFPDIYFEPEHAFRDLVKYFEDSGDCELLLGVFPGKDPTKWDTVKMDSEGNVNEVYLKKQNNRPHSDKAWHLAVWGPDFTHYLNYYLKKRTAELQDKENELELSYIMQEFVREKHTVKALEFKEGRCIDIGTVDDLKKALKDHSGLT